MPAPSRHLGPDLTVGAQASPGLHRHASELVPRPLAADLTGSPPTVTMTVLPGAPVHGVLSPVQLEPELFAAQHRARFVRCGTADRKGAPKFGGAYSPGTAKAH